jgi:hypothetical protein
MADAQVSCLRKRRPSKSVHAQRFTPLSDRRRSGNVIKPTGQSTLMTSKLEQLKKITTVVADTGDFAAIEKLKPVDATTNPSLLLKAASSDSNADRLKEAFSGANNDIGLASDRFAVAIGQEILKVVPGRVSTEVDARISFDTNACIDTCRAPGRAVRQGRHWPRSHPDQAGLDLGRHPRRRAAGKERHSVQPDPAVLLRSGAGLCRRWRVPDFAVRGPHLRLVQEG